MRLERALNFVYKRERFWRIIYFRTDGDADESQFLDYNRMMGPRHPEKQDEPWFRGITYVYYRPSWFKRMFGGRPLATNIFDNLLALDKAYRDSRLLQNILTALPNLYSTLFFEEKANDREDNQLPQ